MGKFGDKPTGAVSAFAIDRATGALTLLNQESSGGSGPAHLSVDRAGRTVLVANYGGGSVASLPIGPDGRLGAGGVGDRAPGLQRAPEAPDQAVRALDQHGHGEHVRLCRRPRRRSHLHLPARSEDVGADARDAGLGGPDARLRPASPLVPPGRPLRLRDQRTRAHGHGVHAATRRAARSPRCSRSARCPRGRRPTLRSAPPKSWCIRRASSCTDPIAGTTASSSSRSTRPRAS